MFISQWNCFAQLLNFTAGTYWVVTKNLARLPSYPFEKKIQSEHIRSSKKNFVPNSVIMTSTIYPSITFWISWTNLFGKDKRFWGTEMDWNNIRLKTLKGGYVELNHPYNWDFIRTSQEIFELISSWSLEQSVQNKIQENSVYNYT